MSNITNLANSTTPSSATTNTQADSSVALPPADPQTSAIARNRRLLAAQNTDGIAQAQATAPGAAPTESLPALPSHPAGQTASAKEAATRVAVLADGAGSGDAISGVAAFLIMFEASQKSQQSANRARVAQQTAANNAQMAGAEAQLRQIQADKASSFVSFGGSLVGAAAPLGILKSVRADGANMAIAQAVAPSSGQAFSSLIDAGNKNVGFGQASYDAQIDQKQDDLAKTIISQAAEGSQNIAKQADSSVDMALRTLGEYFQRKSQTENNIAANV